MDDTPSIAQVDAPAPTELQRAFGGLDKQDKIIKQLESRLDPVIHGQPPTSDAEKAEREHYPHITSIADRIANNNGKLRTLMERLAV